LENESKTENKNQVARLLEKHGDRVFRTAFMYLKNYQDAEDVLQMTFEKYLIAKPLFKSEEHEKAWFLRVAINISKNLVTSGWKKKVISLTKFTGTPINITQSLVRKSSAKAP